MTPPAKSEKGTHPLSKWRRFLICWLFIAVCWLGLFPWISRLPTQADRIQSLERAGIDPSAMYYSELEMMPATLQRLEQLHARNHRLFWERAESSDRK